MLYSTIVKRDDATTIPEQFVFCLLAATTSLAPSLSLSLSPSHSLSLSLSLSLSSSLFCLQYSSINNYLSSSESVLSQVPRRWPPVFHGIWSTFWKSLALARGKRGAALWLTRRLHIFKGIITSRRGTLFQENHTFEGGSQIFSVPPKCSFLSGLSFLYRFFHFSLFFFLCLFLFPGAQNQLFFDLNFFTNSYNICFKKSFLSCLGR